MEDLSYDKVIYYDSEYSFPGTTKKGEWKYATASLRVQTYKIGKGPIQVVDVWKEGHRWNEIFSYLEQGYKLVAHNAIADIRPDICPEGILKYVLNGQIHDTIYLERLIHGMTDPIGSFDQVKDPDSEDEDEEEVEDNKFGKAGTKHFALDSLVYRHTGVILKKLYQDARNYLAKDLSKGILEYAADDVKYLPKIYRQQAQAVKALGLEEVVKMNHKLLATSWIVQKYGIPISYNKLVDFRKEYQAKASDLQQKLLTLLPKVSYSDVQLIDMYFDLYWQKGKGLCGLTNKSKALEVVKKNQNHVVATSCWAWVNDKRDKILRSPNLNAPKQKLEAFHKAGYKIKDTTEATIKEYLSDNDCPILESYLTFTKYNTLLNKVLEKIDYGLYLRRDNTIKSTFTWVRALNGRSSASDMNVQQLPRELKALYSKPPGMVKIEYDYSAIELMKMLNDYPQDDLTRLILNEEEDIHIYNAARFFGQDYQELLRRHKVDKDPEVKRMRNAAKTVIYFLQYKTPKRVEDRYVTGMAKLMEIFKTDLGWTLTEEESADMIVKGEAIIKKWTMEKLNIDSDISKLANERTDLKSELLTPLRNNIQDLNVALEDGIIYFRGAKNMYYKFDLIRDHIYTPEKEIYIEETGEYKTKREYINSRSLYSCRIAGPIAIRAKEAVMLIQEELALKFGPDKARLGLFVHDSMTCYCLPELAEEVERIMVTHMLKAMAEEFSLLPVFIEGGKEGEEKKIGYHNGEFSNFKI